MNMKKKLIAALAAVTAAVSMSAVTANANKLGESTMDLNFDVTAGQPSIFTVTLDGTVGVTLDVTAEVPAGALPEGKYAFHAELFVDKDLEDLFTTTTVLTEDQQIEYFDLLEINFKNEAGEMVYPENVKLSFKTSKATAYNNVYIYDNGSFKLIGDMDGAYPPHFSRFVIAAIVPYEIMPSDIEPSQTSQTSQTSYNPQPSVTPGGQDVKTGDNGAATAVVFSIMAVAALGTSVVALKSKKASK